MSLLLVLWVVVIMAPVSLALRMVGLLVVAEVGPSVRPLGLPLGFDDPSFWCYFSLGIVELAFCGDLFVCLNEKVI